MLRLMRFPQHNNEYAFIACQQSLQPIPMGLHRELWFVSKEEAKEAALENGYWIENDMARTH